MGMYFRASEIVAAAVIFGFLWSVIPWNPLTMKEEIIVCLCLLVTSFSVVLLVEGTVDEIRRKLNEIR